MSSGKRLSRAFQGTDRHELRRRLGAGGMGVVYEAFDRVRGELVALKTLIQFDAEAVYRIKQEFRALCDVTHPNLVGLHELVCHDDQWFFTMERIEGQELLEFVVARPASVAPVQEPMGEEDTETVDTAVGSDAATRGYSVTQARAEAAKAASQALSERPRSSRRRRTVDDARLRASLIQIGEGLNALHEAGKLHRDIKPSNVLVTKSGRVVILDFGLATELYDAYLIRSTQQGVVCGTIAYMSPEQSAGEPLSPASDFYSIGVMLFEAYTGELPFAGAMYRVVLDKQEKDAPRISALVPGVPKDLDDLCAALLDRDPKARPTGRAFQEALGATLGARYTTGPISFEGEDSGPGVSFVGRDEELAALERAYQRAKAGEVAVVEITGDPGIGKSALLRRFLDRRIAEKESGVLVGRCYERELVPFKAVDGFFDALARHLRRLSYAEARALAPPEARLLVRLFPVLGRVDALVGGSDMPMPIQPAELRRLAFSGLRELVRRLSLRQPLVFAIDDVQAGDADSGELIAALLEGPEAPPVLWVLVHRGEGGPLLGALHRAGIFRPSLESMRLDLLPLKAKDATALATAALARGPSPPSPESAELIARESRGSPLLVLELASYDLGAGGPEAQVALTTSSDARLAAAAQARFDSLPPEARRLLEVVALCPGPVPLVVAHQAADITKADRIPVSVLMARRMVRRTPGGPKGSPFGEPVGAEATLPLDGRTSNRISSSSIEDELIEVLHDRVRETALVGLTPEVRRAHHMALARALGHRQGAPEGLIHHLEQAGERQEAGKNALIAARAAAEGLAFDRAASLFRMAIELEAASDLRPIRVELAEALANAGLANDAAQAFLLAAGGAERAEHQALLRRAAEQYLIGGHVEQGLAVFEKVLKAVDLRFPKDVKSAFRATAIFRGALWLRGLHVELTDPAKIPTELKEKIDVCWSLATGLAMVDAIRAAYFGTRMLGFALTAGDPERAVRALAFEVALVETLDPSHNRAPQAMRSLKWAAKKADTPHGRALVALASGFSAYMQGNFALARTELQRAELIARYECVGARWEAETAQYMHLASLGHLGELAELARQTREALSQGRNRLSLYASTLIAVSPHVGAHLMAIDQPEDLIRQSQSALATWSVRGFFLEHFLATSSAVQAELYQGKGEAAYQRLKAQSREVERSLITRMRLIAVEVHDLLARTALGAATGGYTEDRVKEALAATRPLDSSPIPHAKGLALLVRGQVAEHRKKDPRPQYIEAHRIFKASGMKLQALLIRRRLAILQDQSGLTDRAAAERELLELGVTVPASYARVWLPLVSR